MQETLIKVAVGRSRIGVRFVVVFFVRIERRVLHLQKQAPRRGVGGGPEVVGARELVFELEGREERSHVAGHG